MSLKVVKEETILILKVSDKYLLLSSTSSNDANGTKVGSKVLLEKGYLTVIIELLPGRLYISSLFLILSSRFGTEL